MQLPRALSVETEQLIHRVIGLCIEVHRTLGPGLPERAYSRAVALELQIAGIRYDRERALEVRYRGRVVCVHRVDFIVAGMLVLELKSVERLESVHTAQALTYLRISGICAALLINFNVAVLREGIRRVIL